MPQPARISDAKMKTARRHGLGWWMSTVPDPSRNGGQLSPPFLLMVAVDAHAAHRGTSFELRDRSWTRVRFAAHPPSPDLRADARPARTRPRGEAWRNLLESASEERRISESDIDQVSRATSVNASTRRRFSSGVPMEMRAWCLRPYPAIGRMMTPARSSDSVTSAPALPIGLSHTNGLEVRLIR